MVDEVEWVLIEEGGSGVIMWGGVGKGEEEVLEEVGGEVEGVVEGEKKVGRE